MDPIISFILDRAMPEEQNDAKKIRCKSAQFLLSKEKKLYRRSFEGPYLLCVHPEAVDKLLVELHEGVWEPYGRSVLSPSSNGSRILAAEYSEGCRELC